MITARKFLQIILYVIIANSVVAVQAFAYDANDSFGVESSDDEGALFLGGSQIRVPVRVIPKEKIPHGFDETIDDFFVSIVCAAWNGIGGLCRAIFSDEKAD